MSIGLIQDSAYGQEANDALETIFDEINDALILQGTGSGFTKVIFSD